MKALTAFVALLVTIVFVIAGSAFAGTNEPFHEDRYENFLYEGEKSMAGNLEEIVGPEPLYEDRYENCLYEETETERAEMSAPSDTRFFGIEPAWLTQKPCRQSRRPP